MIHESPTNPRRSFSEAGARRTDLAKGVRRHGVLQPILVRANGDGFVLIAGARRLRGEAAGCGVGAPRVLDLDDAAADRPDHRNLHRGTSTRSTEGVSYQRLVSSGPVIRNIAAALGKVEGLRLSAHQPDAARAEGPGSLLARDILPLIYALKIAVVPAEQQEEALAKSSAPLP